jgi:phage-related protein
VPLAWHLTIAPRLFLVAIKGNFLNFVSKAVSFLSEIERLISNVLNVLDFLQSASLGS